MNLVTIIRALAKQYEDNEELTKTQNLAATLKILSEEINETANDLEEVYRRVAAGERGVNIKRIRIEREIEEHKRRQEEHKRRQEQQPTTENQKP